MSEFNKMVSMPNDKNDIVLEQQKRINELESENRRLKLWYKNVKLQFENKEIDCDELQKRIDRALIQVSNHYHSCVARKNIKRLSASVSEVAEIESHESNMCVLENILKGNQQ